MKNFIVFISILVCISLVLPHVGAVSIIDKIETNTFTLEYVDNSGQILSFSFFTDVNGNPIIYYYYNNMLTITYVLSKDSNSVIATDANGYSYQVSQSSGFLSREVISINEIDGSYNPRNVAEISYNPCDRFPTSTIVLFSDVTNVYQDRYYITTSEGELFADALVSLANALLGIVFVEYEITFITCSQIANNLLSSAIANEGASVVEGLITAAISDSYDSIVHDHLLRATFYSPNYQLHPYQNYTGTSEYITYDGVSYSDIVYEGYTSNPSNWHNTAFALKVWRDTIQEIGGWECPGIKQFRLYV